MAALKVSLGVVGLICDCGGKRRRIVAITQAKVIKKMISLAFADLTQLSARTRLQMPSPRNSERRPVASTTTKCSVGTMPCGHS